MSVKGGGPIYRSLAGLRRSGATSRLWDVAGHTERVLAKSAEAPMLFRAPALNKCLILKHRLRPGEYELFDAPRSNGTKVILPFSLSNLAMGGRSIFVGERRWTDALADMVHEQDHLDRDVALLSAIAELPSLDPFLLREHLRRRKFDVPPEYLEISRGDQLRMQSYSAAQISKLIGLALDGVGGRNSSRASALLLTGDVAGQMEPLRKVLRLDETSFAEGVFCWRGFLYYKWVLTSSWPRLKEVIKELGQLSVSGPSNDLAVELTQRRENLLRTVTQQIREANGILAIYDNAFALLTEREEPGAFRDFLLRAPELFPALGELAAGVSHITSYWRYRFPLDGPPKRIGPEELLEILVDFLSLTCDPDDDLAQYAA